MIAIDNRHQRRKMVETSSFGGNPDFALRAAEAGSCGGNGMYRIEQKSAENGWQLVGDGWYDAVLTRNHAEAAAEKTGIPHRVISERHAVIYCSGCKSSNPVEVSSE